MLAAKTERSVVFLLLFLSIARKTNKTLMKNNRLGTMDSNDFKVATILQSCSWFCSLEWHLRNSNLIGLAYALIFLFEVKVALGFKHCYAPALQLQEEV